MDFIFIFDPTVQKYKEIFPNYKTPVTILMIPQIHSC